MHGARYLLKYPKKVICGTCGGSKCEKHTAPSKCWTCGGKGFIHFKNAAQHSKESCPKCRGGGMTIKHPCQACKGEGIVDGDGEALVHIPRGSQSGERLVVREKGHDSYNGKPGDLVVRLGVRKDGRFWQEGEDLNSHHLLSVPESMLGTKTKITTLYGDYNVEVAEGMRPGDKIAIREFGCKVRPKKADRPDPAAEKGEAPPQTGAHIVHIGIRIPQKLTDRERELYLRLASYEGERFGAAVPEEQLDLRAQVHDLDLKGSREHREFAESLERWKKREEVDVFVDENNAARPNLDSANEKLKKKLAESAQPN